MTTSGFDLSIAQRQALGDLSGRDPRLVQVVLPLPTGTEVDELARRVGAAHARYDILRTVFVRPVGLTTVLQSLGDTPAPEVADHGRLPLAEATNAERAAGLSPGPGPVLRVAVASDHLVLTALAAVADQASLRLLGGELLGAEALSDPLQFVDYASWEAEQLEDDAADARIARSFWATMLGDLTPSPVQPLPVHELRGIAIEPGRHDAATWLALWVALRGRYAAPDAAGVVVAVAVSGRVDDDLAGAIGPYERYVPLLVPDDTRVTRAALAGRLAADVRSLERFVVFAPPADTDAAFSVRESSSATPARGAYPLELVVTGDSAVLWYAPDVLSDGRAGWLAEQLTTLAAAPADKPLAVVDCVGPAERDELSRLLNGTGIQPPTASVREVLREHARSRPDRPAVVHGDQEMTFAALDARAAAVAAAVGSGAPTVGVLLERSLDLVAAAMGALYAGSAYVVLEPANPPARIAEQLTTADVQVVVTDRVLRSSLPSSVRTVVVDDLGAAASPDLATAPAPAAVSASSPAYVIFTSGSTGVPKAVVVTHGNLLAYGASIARRLELDAGTRFGSVTGLSTDLGNTAVFGALLAGGTLELVPADILGDGPALAALLAAHGVTALKITPSHLRALLAGGDVRLDLPLLVVGGESLDAQLVADARAAGVGRVVNHYGPTETTIGVFTHEASDAPSSAVPIGRPLDHVRAHILDRQGRLTPLGAVGELCIGGPSVAAGYLNLPAETAERFVPEPGHGTPMYRTGDNVRVDADGDVVFLGRSDGQIKIRGYRVELGEIESRLRAVESIDQAAVVVEGESLVAYVVGSGTNAEQVKRRLGEQLPAHMVPQQIVGVDRIPLTPSGKLDRRRLADLRTASEPASSGRPPLTETETALVTIWSEVLGTSSVGVEDNFFQIGGHSLIATKVIARSRAHFGIDIPLHVIFAHSSVEAMAADIDARVAAAPAADTDDDLAGLLDDLDSMSDEEAARRLNAPSPRNGDAT